MQEYYKNYSKIQNYKQILNTLYMFLYAIFLIISSDMFLADKMLKSLYVSFMFSIPSAIVSIPSKSEPIPMLFSPSSERKYSLCETIS